MVKIASFFIKFQMVLSLAIFVFSQPLQINRTVLFEVKFNKKILQDEVDKSRKISFFNSKLKLLLKPRHIQQIIKSSKIKYIFQDILHSIKLNLSIFKPPKLSLSK